MSPSVAVSRCLRRYADPSGRAPRSEYWWWIAFVLFGSFLTSFLHPLWLAFSAATFLPGCAVLMRRLHDCGWSGWWLAAFIALLLASLLYAATGVPATVLLPLALPVFLLGLVLTVLCLRAGDPAPNRYGSPPAPAAP